MMIGWISPDALAAGAAFRLGVPGLVDAFIQWGGWLTDVTRPNGDDGIDSRPSATSSPEGLKTFGFDGNEQPKMGGAAGK